MDLVLGKYFNQLSPFQSPCVTYNYRSFRQFTAVSIWDHAGTAGNSQKLPGTTGNCRKLQETAKNCLKLLETMQ